MESVSSESELIKDWGMGTFLMFDLYVPTSILGDQECCEFVPVKWTFAADEFLRIELYLEAFL